MLKTMFKLRLANKKLLWNYQDIVSLFVSLNDAITILNVFKLLSYIFLAIIFVCHTWRLNF